MAIRDTTVKFFQYDQAGAPTLVGNPSSPIALLDALLPASGGYGAFTPDSITVSSGIATLTKTGGHGITNPGAAYAADVGAVMAVSGVVGAHTDLNREWRMTVISATLAIWECGTTIPDGTMAGTITVKRAPLGWDTVYTASGKRVYRSALVETSRALLRVEHGARNPLIRGYADMADIDTGTGAFPAIGTPYYCPIYSGAAESLVKRWRLYGDGRTFYLWFIAEPDADGRWHNPLSFGDFTSLSKYADPGRCFIVGGPNDDYGVNYGMVQPAGVNNCGYIASGYVPGSSPVGFSYSVLGPTNLEYPDPCTGTFMVFPCSVREGTNPFIRGLLRGRIGLANTGTGVTEPMVGLYGENASHACYVHNSYNGAFVKVAADLLGPWI